MAENITIALLVMLLFLLLWMVARIVLDRRMERWNREEAPEIRQQISERHNQFETYLQSSEDPNPSGHKRIYQAHYAQLNVSIQQARENWENWAGPLQDDLSRAAACCVPWGAGQNPLVWLFGLPVIWLWRKGRIDRALALPVKTLVTEVETAQTGITGVVPKIDKSLNEHLAICEDILATADWLKENGFPSSDYQPEQTLAQDRREEILKLQKRLHTDHPDQAQHESEVDEISGQAGRLAAQLLPAQQVLLKLRGRYEALRDGLGAAETQLGGLVSQLKAIAEQCSGCGSLEEEARRARQNAGSLREAIKAPQSTKLDGWQQDLAALEAKLQALSLRLKEIGNQLARFQAALNSTRAILQTIQTGMQALESADEFRVRWKKTHETREALWKAVQPYGETPPALPSVDSLPDLAKAMQENQQAARQLQQEFDRVKQVHGRAVNLLKNHPGVLKASLDEPLKKIEDRLANFRFHSINLPENLRNIAARREEYRQFDAVLAKRQGIDEEQLTSEFITALEGALKGMQRLHASLQELADKVDTQLAEVEKWYAQAAAILNNDLAPLVERGNGSSVVQPVKKTIEPLQVERGELFEQLQQNLDRSTQPVEKLSSVLSKARVWRDRVVLQLKAIDKAQVKQNKEIEANLSYELDTLKLIPEDYLPKLCNDARDARNTRQQAAPEDSSSAANLAVWLQYVDGLFKREELLNDQLKKVQECFVPPSAEQKTVGSQYPLPKAPAIFHPMLVRIWDEDNKRKGLGILVGQQTVITSARVLLGPTTDPLPRQQPSGRIRIDFPFIPQQGYWGKQKINAKIQTWGPAKRSSGCDFAMLQLSDPIPKGAVIAPVISGGMLIKDDACRTLGFPPDFPMGLQVRCKIGAKTNDEVYQIGERAGACKIGPDFIGAPVWDEHLQCVIGMVIDGPASQPGSARILPVSQGMVSSAALFGNIAHPKRETHGQVALCLSSGTRSQYTQGGSFSKEKFRAALASVLHVDLSKVTITEFALDNADLLTVELPVEDATQLVIMIANRDERMRWLNIEPFDGADINVRKSKLSEQEALKKPQAQTTK